MFNQLDYNKSGDLDLKEYKAAAGGDPATVAIVSAVFDMADSDKDGVLSCEEFVQYNLETGKNLGYNATYAV